MPSDLRVVEDGADRKSVADRPMSAGIWVVGALVVGVLFGVVVANPSSQPAAQEEPVAEAAPSVGPVGAATNAGGVMNSIDGFSDALVGVTRTGTATLSHMLWPIDGELVTWPLAVGGNAEARFDATGTWLAATTQVPDSEGLVLTMGKPASMVPVASNVSSFSWHDAEVGVLAYTQELDGVWTLTVNKGGQTPLTIASGNVGKGDVVAWGDWGFAIQDDALNVTLFNDNAEIRATAVGRILDSHPSGWLLLHEDTYSLLSAGGGIKRLGITSSSVGGTKAAALSPNGDKLAVLGSVGVKISAIRGEMPTVEVPFTTPLSRIKWSSDSRFVMVPFLQGLIVVDTDNGRTYEVLSEHTLIEIGVISLSG